MSDPPPGLDVRDRVVHYWVTGWSGAQLARTMRLNGPRGYAAYTDWALEWTRERVRVDVTITLPKWLEPSRPDAALKSEWDAFVAGLRAHEEGHREIAVRAGVAVLALLREGDVQADASVARRIEGAIALAREAERAFDAETRHGEIERTSTTIAGAIEEVR